MKKKSVVLLILLLVLIISIPVVFIKNSEFQGTDTVAENMISQTNPDYKPWIKSIWKPPSGEMESFIFALQAAIGAGVIGYGIGYMRGIHKTQKSEKKQDQNKEIQ
ncbi:energy-coupling factor ABC transporter substrate-binding protein [Clostridium cellulovorans]|uniref:Cobalt transport protein CbiN n=1 Tax=Clostridium cellulovorans (strain ATCC 35296 / DSM 3052 / OCM 3 / 743B) TaxID=573061 RepID=D9SNZ4_CLOC7|nr:energy-coupling factor ABC transporter substrate-binding protein [Clostridium cellulovorans]ADL51959.1 Cobalt transport protein CbiN [Clostridium cellulovorans 743B]